MSAVWCKTLASTDIYNKINHARDATQDVEVSNIETFLENFMKF